MLISAVASTYFNVVLPLLLLNDDDSSSNGISFDDKDPSSNPQVTVVAFLLFLFILVIPMISIVFEAQNYKSSLVYSFGWLKS